MRGLKEEVGKQSQKKRCKKIINSMGSELRFEGKEKF